MEKATKKLDKEFTPEKTVRRRKKKKQGKRKKTLEKENLGRRVKRLLKHVELLPKTETKSIVINVEEAELIKFKFFVTF